MKSLILGICMFISSLGLCAFASGTNEPTTRDVIILMGPPGSGKGTQAVRLSKELGFPHISTGDLFRENISKNTGLGRKAKSYINTGNLVPDSLVLDMLFARVAQPDCSKGYLLDGFPRTIPQAEALDKHLTKQDRLIVLNLEASDDVIFKRIEGRLSCKQCGSVYNRYFSPPKTEGTCDKCGGELVQRSDDRAEVVRERLKVYHQQTEPLIDYYRQKNVLDSVNGEENPDEVFKELLAKYRSKIQLLSGK